MRPFLTAVMALLTALYQVQTALAQSTGQAPFGNPFVTVLKLILSLGLIVILAIGLIRFLAKRTQVEQRGSIQVIAARQLAPNKSIQVVNVEGRTFVLGVGDDVRLLSEMTEFAGSATVTRPVVTAVPPSEAPTAFGGILAESLQSLRKKHQGTNAGEETLR